jgi:hypothetical protein
MLSRQRWSHIHCCLSFPRLPPGKARLRRGISAIGLALASAVLASGCGGGGGGVSRSEACATLEVAPVSRPADATKVLRSVIAADQAALDALDASDPLAARFRGAKAKAEQALASFTGDQLSMSPRVTILPTAQRVVAETRLLRRQLCDSRGTTSPDS